jgi:enoyl-CoA hydratase/carnithine racemase
MFARDRRHVPLARGRSEGARDPAVGPGHGISRRARPPICRFAIPAEPRSRPAAEARLRHIHWLQDAFSAVEQARAPVIAAIHGGCIGAGVDLASACDIRLCSADAFFQVAEVDVAITADLGTLQRLTHLIPEGVVRELAYTGRRMDSEEAARLGALQDALRRDGFR